MKKLIHKYLTRNYKILKNKVVKLDGTEILSESVISETNQIFLLSKKEIKWYIKSWIRKQNRGFNFNKWWADTYLWGSIALPLVRRVFTSVVAQDLVSVQPMGPTPTGLLFYYDFQTNPEEFAPRPGIRERYSREQLNEDAYDSVRITRMVDDESEARAVSEMINDWRNLIYE